VDPEREAKLKEEADLKKRQEQRVRDLRTKEKDEQKEARQKQALEGQVEQLVKRWCVCC